MAATRTWIGGTARSGTTWLCNVMAIPGTEQVFEPLFPKAMDLPPDLDPPMQPHMRPYLRPDDEYPTWERYVEAIYSGAHRNLWTRFGHHSRLLWPMLWLRSLRTSRVLVKEVRGNLMLGWLARKLDGRVVYILRHPCATVQSLRRKDMHLELAPLLADERLCADWLQPHLDFLRDEIRTPLQIQAASWAVENLVPLRQARDASFLFVTYESLLLDPSTVLERILRHVGWEPSAADRRAIAKRLPQPVSGLEQRLTPRELLAKWRNDMTTAEIDEVLSICHRLGIDAYTSELEPDRDRLVQLAGSAGDGA